MTSERLEFRMSQYLDGTLSEADRVALERHLAADPQARQVMEEYRSLDVAIRRSAGMPAVKWDRLADSISDAAAAQAAEMDGGVAGLDQPIDEGLEIAIIRYIEGDLTDAEREALEQRLAADPAARHALAEHRSLDAVVKNAWPMPHVDHEALQRHIADRIDEAEAPAAIPLRRVVTWGVRMAIAACILLVAGIVAHMAMKTPIKPDGPIAVGPKIVKVDIDPVAMNVKQVNVVVQVSIGPAPDLAQGGDAYAAEVMSHPRKMEVAASVRLVSQENPSYPW